MKYLIISLFIVLLVSCSDKDNKSDAYGNFEAKEIIVSSEVNGKLLSFTPEEGDQIDSGVIIGYIDTMQLYLGKKVLEKQKQTISTKFNQIMAQIEIYRKQKDNLLFERDRLKKLVNDGAAPQKQLDDIVNQIKVIEEQINAVKTQNSTTIKEVESIDFQIKKINDQILRSIIINPVKGTVLEKYLEEHEMAIAGKPIYKIADMSELFLRVYISGKQLSSIKTGQKVSIYTDTENGELKELRGTVSWISDQAEFTPKIIQTREERINLVYAVKIKVKNDGSLKIGMPGEIKFKSFE